MRVVWVDFAPGTAHPVGESAPLGESGRAQETDDRQRPACGGTHADDPGPNCSGGTDRHTGLGPPGLGDAVGGRGPSSPRRADVELPGEVRTWVDRRSRAGAPRWIVVLETTSRPPTPRQPR